MGLKAGNPLVFRLTLPAKYRAYGVNGSTLCYRPATGKDLAPADTHVEYPAVLDAVPGEEGHVSRYSDPSVETESA